VSLADSRVRGSRALLVAAVVLMLTGTCGVGNGIVGVSTEGAAEAPRILPANASLEVVEASDALHTALARTAREAPFRRALDSANVLLSAMLLAGGVLLILLRKSGPWWVTQATVANILWTAAYAGTHVYQLQVNAGELRRLLRELAAAMAADPQIQEGSLPMDELTLTIAMRIGLATLAIAVYGWIAWRIRKPDVRAVLEEAERTRGT
jgi:hypothetical protein